MMDRRVVITGANSGLGFETARAMARRGDHVVLAVRDLARGRAAATRIAAQRAGVEVEVLRLDLADLGAVAAFAEEYRSRFEGPDVLVNNAGVMAIPRQLSADGFEMQMATNFLGHFALTGRLLPAMLERPAARVVTVSSLLHRLGRIPFGDFHAERRYFKWLVYCNTKLADLLFAFELQRRAEAAGCDLLSVAAHPGYSSTGLQFAGPRMSGNRVKEHGYKWLNRLVGQSAADGARPSVHAATEPVSNGSYFGPDGLLEVSGTAPREVKAVSRAQDPAMARRLWELAERLTAVCFDFAGPAGDAQQVATWTLGG